MRNFEDSECLFCPRLYFCREDIMPEDYMAMLESAKDILLELQKCRILKFLNYIMGVK